MPLTIAESALKINLRSAREGAAPLVPWNRRVLLFPVIAVGVGCCLIPHAATSYRAVHHVLAALPLRSFFSACVQFATWTMIVGAGLIIWALDRPRRVLLAYCLTALIVSCSFNAVVKIVTGRVRPEWSVALDAKNKEKLLDAEEDHYDMPIADDPSLTNDKWLWFSSDRSYLFDRFASFPSGHACALFALAAFLRVVYPNGRFIWVVAAIGGSLARVRFERHFPEDILIGGAIGWTVAYWVFSWSWLMTYGRHLTNRIELAGRGLGQRGRSSGSTGHW